MPSYEPVDNDVTKIVDHWLKKDHSPRLQLEDTPPTIDCLYFVDHKGGALKLHGYPCIAIIKLNSVKDRVRGFSDATITINKRVWDTKSEEEKHAIIDHELEHLESTKDKKTKKPKYDAAARPQLWLKLHDWQLGGFKVVVERHGKAAAEFQAMDAFASSFAQLMFPWAGNAPEAKKKKKTAKV